MAAPAPRTASEGVAAVPLPAVLARADEAPFVGRAEELERLQSHWHTNSGTRLVVVTGEQGIGKTRLAARFAATVHSQGGTVLCGRADAEAVWPHQPFVEALRHYAAHRANLVEDAGLPRAACDALGLLVPELAAPGGRAPLNDRDELDQRRRQLFEAVVGLLLHAARPGGLLLVLDDLQWIDKATTLMLRHLLRRAALSRLLVLATCDDSEGPGSSPWTDLRHEAELSSLQLAGLTQAEAADLAAAHMGADAADDESIERLYRKSGGNPLFINELLRSAPRDDDPSIPDAVKHVIGQRLDRLAPAALEILTLAAVLGHDFRLTSLEVVAPEHDQDELLDALEAAVAAGLIVEHSDEVDCFSFSHSLARRTLYERPIASRRLRLHRHVAEALENSPLPVHPAELAHHYFKAREVGGAAKAVVSNLEAAEAAQAARAYDAAAEHYERALSVLPLVGRNDSAARCDVLLALGAARWQASEPDPRATFAEALTLARELGSADRLARAVLGAGGRFYAPVTTDVAYADLLEQALAALEPGDSALRVQVLARLAENCSFAAPDQRARELANEAVAMARRLAEPDALAAALMGRHAALLHVEHAQERRRIGEELVAVADELDDLELGALARHWLLYDLAELGDRAAAQRRHAELERLARQLRQPLYLHSALAWRCVGDGLAGRFGEAEQVARESLALAENAGAPDAQNHFTAQLVAIRREQGRLDELLHDIEPLAEAEGVPGAWSAILPLAYLDAGDRPRAQAAYARAMSGAPATSPPNMLWLTTMASLCEVAAQLGDSAGCERLYAELSPHADRLVQWSFTGTAGSVRRLLGRAAAVAGRRDEAYEHFEAALARHSSLGAPALTARTACDYGELLLQGSRADHARGHELLHDAASVAQGLGMRGIAARATPRSARSAPGCSC